MKKSIFNHKIGIIGGGQLGKMILNETNKWSLNISILDSNKNSPCKNLCNGFYVGDLLDYETVLNFGRKCDLITYEIEHINTQALFDLEKEGIIVYPKAETLKIIQNKNSQKEFYKRNELPTADFSFYKSIDDLKIGIKEGKVKFPSVWKKTKFGYDGFGVKILKSTKDLNDIPESEMIIEKLIPFEKEIAVIVARNSKGKIKNFDVVEMEFNEISNQVEFVISPSNISEEIKKQAIEIAIETAEKFNLIGLLAVEMFLTKDNQILINEVAPRPHNSGHYTLDACNTSQFEQHIRAILGLELGDVSQKGKAIMLNLVGEENFFGKVIYSNLDDALADDSSYVHIYGKEETRPNRKMGHITIICDNFEDAYIKAKNFKNTIKVKSINNG
ncbi:MAG: 5-(carboxyamino)imidazole ribonucleotide synthase [Flavobacteriaceae bacterium]|nr:5-(carboxyamino)imidazole ribonucleotide synthase [Flavobacteriaceae bacterium]